MEVNLSKKDILHLLRGVEISDYKTLFEVKEIWGLGDYTGGFVDSFEWHGTNSTIWDKYSEKELYELYIKLTKD